MRMHLEVPSRLGSVGDVTAACHINSGGMPKARYDRVTRINLSIGNQQGLTLVKTSVTCGNCKRTQSYKAAK